MEKRLGVVAIVIEGSREVSLQIQEILTDFSDIIIGRMGVPDEVKKISVISLIVKGTVERISAMTGKIGRLANVSIKSAVTNVTISEE